MGRVYDVEPKAGERWGNRHRVFRAADLWKNADGSVSVGKWVPLGLVYRVEFDGDADEGPATVYAFAADAEGRMFTDESGVEIARVSFRTTAKIEPMPGAPAADAPVVVG
jgi:hypothetical protein